MAHFRDFDEPDWSLTTEADDDPRRAARILAMQFLHQLTAQDGASLELLDAFLDGYSDHPDTLRLARGWIRGAWQQRDAIDELIRSVSDNWDLNRISQVDRSNLELAVYQLMFCVDIPHKVAINEAVELAKMFSTNQAPGFINGILDAIWKKNAEQTQNGRPSEPES
jgi:transcription antitermination protein NusB